MSRAVLPEDQIHPAIRETISELNRDLVAEVQAAVEKNDVVVVGMRQNPVPKQARALLKRERIDHEYLEYGSYLNTWRRRNALKMWTGWPTFPMIFVKGTFVGGNQELTTLHKNGELKTLLDQ